MNNLQENIDYIYSYLVDLNQGKEAIDKKTIYGMMEESLLDMVEDVLMEEDYKNIAHSNDGKYLDQILSERLENYPDLLEEIKNDILNDYVLSST